MIREYIEQVITKALPANISSGVVLGIEHPRDKSHGDFSCNVAMALAKKLKQAPLEIAKGLVKEIKKHDNRKYFKEVAAVAPGFINISLSDIYFGKILEEIISRGDKFGRGEVGEGKKIVLEYSAPNTNKALHIGHFRNDTIGMAMNNIFTALGYEVIPVLLLNDKGLQICKAMLMYQKFGEGKTPAEAGMKPDHFVADFYAHYEKEAEKDPALEKEASALLVSWEKGDKETRSLWKKLNDWVYEGYQQTYKREGSKFDDVVLESDIYDKGKSIVKEYLKKGLFQKKPDGAVTVDLSKFGLDEKVLQRSDGTSIYITQDIYLGEMREKKYHPDRMLYVVDVTQSYHFKVLFAIYELLGYKWAQRSHHLAYGYVYLGKEKMASRKGNVILTDDFIEEMTKRAVKVMKASKVQVDKENEAKTTEAIALAAMKYGMLSYELKRDIHFDKERTIQLTGRTGPYLQYTYARTQSILEKGGNRDSDKVDLSFNEVKSEEVELLRRLYLLPEVIVSAAENYEPHFLTDYLYELAQSFNTFYNNIPVLKADTQESLQIRLALCRATGQVLKNGLELLGITALAKM